MEQLTGWAHGAADQDRSVGLVGYSTGIGSRRKVQFVDSILQSMKFQPVSVSTKRVGKNDVGSSRHVGTVDVPDAVRMIHVPDLGWVSGGQAGREELGSHGTVGHQDAPGLEEFLPAAHAPNLPPEQFRTPDSTTRLQPLPWGHRGATIGPVDQLGVRVRRKPGRRHRELVGSGHPRDAPASSWRRVFRVGSPESRGSVTAYAFAVLHGLPTLIVAR